jgi:transcriptional regulator with XRE-family HTH domain
MVRRKPGRPGITDEQADRVRDLLQRLTRERFENNASAFARALGLSSSAISQMISRKNRPSYDTVLLLAKYLDDAPPEEILAGKARAPSAVADPYPARASAIRRIGDMLPADVEARVRAVILDETEPPFDEAKWIRLALKWRDEHSEEEQFRKIGRT